MERRAPFLAGLINLIGARRLKPQLDDDLAFGNGGTDNLSVSLLSHSLGDSIAHPACGVVRECPCKDFYEDLKKICDENIHKYLPVFASKDRKNCSNLVYRLWNDQSDDGITRAKEQEKEYKLVYKLYLAPSSTQLSIPVFWSGFSWRIGTRQTMDAILRDASDGSLILRDIEHADTPIGKLLRSHDWYRACHGSSHDSDLWVALSKISAFSARHSLKKEKRSAAVAGSVAANVGYFGGAAAGMAPGIGLVAAVEAGALGGTAAVVGSAVALPLAIGGSIAGIVGGVSAGITYAQSREAAIPSVVVLLVNYYVQKLEDSFLVKHELRNLNTFSNIVILDFKNHCSPSLVQMVKSRSNSRNAVVSCLSATEVAVRHGKEQLSSIGEYARLVPHLGDRTGRSRETRVLEMLNNIQKFVKTADSLIYTLESCYTRGIAWRTPAQPIDTSVVVGNARKDDITECQKRCGFFRDCSHFNFFTENQTCQLLSRNETLFYEVAAFHVISGRPLRSCSNRSEDAERAAKEKKIREELKTVRVSEAKRVRTIDVTSLVRTIDLKKTDHRCCCDKRKIGDAGKEDDKRGINSTARANYCTFAYAPCVLFNKHHRKCGDVKVRHDTKKAHNFESTGGKCEILRDDVPDLVKILNTTDYCPKNEYEFMNMKVDIPVAALGETRNAPCMDGSLGTVRCQVGTPEVGYWGAVECSGKPAWCPSIPKVDDAAPEVAAAKLGENSSLLCNPGESSTEKTKCSERGWIPEIGRTSFTEWNEYGFPPVCFQD